MNRRDQRSLEASGTNRNGEGETQTIWFQTGAMTKKSV